MKTLIYLTFLICFAFTTKSQTKEQNTKDTSPLSKEYETCQTMCNEYKENIVQVEFVSGTQAFNKYGRYVAGGFNFPKGNTDFFKPNDKSAQNSKPVKLSLKVTPEVKGIFQLTDDDVKKLLDEGFFFADVKSISPIGYLATKSDK